MVQTELKESQGIVVWIRREGDNGARSRLLEINVRISVKVKMNLFANSRLWNVYELQNWHLNINT
jgi:hypothetical protein